MAQTLNYLSAGATRRGPQIKAIRGATGEVCYFETEAEAIRFCLRRGDVNELWRVVR